MKKQIQPPGQSQEEQFKIFIKTLVEKYHALQVYCFGKTTELTNKEGCFVNAKSEEKHHYFLLMVTEAVTRIEHEVQEYANANYLFGSITILVHGKQTIAEAIHQNSRFFITVLSGAKCIYTHDGLLQPVSSVVFIPTHAAEKARKHYHHRMQLASGFLESAKECQNKELYHLSVFMLHQAVEQCCIALIRVHLAYRSDIHNLYRQLRLCDSFSSAPSKLFLSSGEDKRTFEIMVKSYSAARYKDDFHVDQGDSEQLYIRVSILLDLCDVLCGEKIEALSMDVESYKLFQTEREVCDVQ